MTDWNSPAELFSYVDSQARKAPQVPEESKQEAIRCAHRLCGKEIVSSRLLYSPLLQRAYCGDYCYFGDMIFASAKKPVAPVLVMPIGISLEEAKLLKRKGML